MKASEARLLLTEAKKHQESVEVEKEQQKAEELAREEEGKQKALEWLDRSLNEELAKIHAAIEKAGRYETTQELVYRTKDLQKGEVLARFLHENIPLALKAEGYTVQPSNVEERSEYWERDEMGPAGGTTFYWVSFSISWAAT